MALPPTYLTASSASAGPVLPGDAEGDVDHAGQARPHLLDPRLLGATGPRLLDRPAPASRLLAQRHRVHRRDGAVHRLGERSDGAQPVLELALGAQVVLGLVRT
jgi:hypothetical protein